jgi:hypothetical protein
MLNLFNKLKSIFMFKSRKKQDKLTSTFIKEKILLSNRNNSINCQAINIFNKNSIDYLLNDNKIIKYNSDNVFIEISDKNNYINKCALKISKINRIH